MSRFKKAKIDKMIEDKIGFQNVNLINQYMIFFMNQENILIENNKLRSKLINWKNNLIKSTNYKKFKPIIDYVIDIYNRHCTTDYIFFPRKCGSDMRINFLKLQILINHLDLSENDILNLTDLKNSNCYDKLDNISQSYIKEDYEINYFDKKMEFIYYLELGANKLVDIKPNKNDYYFTFHFFARFHEDDDYDIDTVRKIILDVINNSSDLFSQMKIEATLAEDEEINYGIFILEKIDFNPGRKL